MQAFPGVLVILFLSLPVSVSGLQALLEPSLGYMKQRENSRDLPPCFLLSNFERVLMFGLHAFSGFLGKGMSTLPFKAAVKFIFKI